VNYMYFHRYTLGTFAVIVITIFYGETRFKFFELISFLSLALLTCSMFSVWKHKVATVDLTIRNRGIFGTCLFFFLLFHSLTLILQCSMVLFSQ